MTACEQPTNLRNELHAQSTQQSLLVHLEVASPHCRHTPGISSTHLFFLCRQMYRAAIKIINRGMAGDPSISVGVKNVNAYTRLANLLKQNSSRLEEAYTLCQSAISLVPTHALAHSQMGDILLRMSRYSAAKAALTTALHLEWRNPTAHYSLGLVNQELGEERQAEQNFRTALSLTGNNQSLTVMLQLASVLQRSQDIKKLQDAEQL